MHDSWCTCCGFKTHHTHHVYITFFYLSSTCLNSRFHSLIRIYLWSLWSTFFHWLISLLLCLSHRFAPTTIKFNIEMNFNEASRMPRSTMSNIRAKVSNGNGKDKNEPIKVDENVHKQLIIINDERFNFLCVLLLHSFHCDARGGEPNWILTTSKIMQTILMILNSSELVCVCVCACGHWIQHIFNASKQQNKLYSHCSPCTHTHISANKFRYSPSCSIAPSYLNCVSFTPTQKPNSRSIIFKWRNLGIFCILIGSSVRFLSIPSLIPPPEYRALLSPPPKAVCFKSFSIHVVHRNMYTIQVYIYMQIKYGQVWFRRSESF